MKTINAQSKLVDQYGYYSFRFRYSGNDNIIDNQYEPFWVFNFYKAALN